MFCFSVWSLFLFHFLFPAFFWVIGKFFRVLFSWSTVFVSIAFLVVTLNITLYKHNLSQCTRLHFTSSSDAYLPLCPSNLTDVINYLNCQTKFRRLTKENLPYLPIILLTIILMLRVLILFILFRELFLVILLE